MGYLLLYTNHIIKTNNNLIINNEKIIIQLCIKYKNKLNLKKRDTKLYTKNNYKMMGVSYVR